MKTAKEILETHLKKISPFGTATVSNPVANASMIHAMEEYANQFKVNDGVSFGFKIDIIKNNVINKGTGVLMVNPADFPKCNSAHCIPEHNWKDEPGHEGVDGINSLGETGTNGPTETFNGKQG